MTLYRPETTKAIKDAIASGPADGELVFYRDEKTTYQCPLRTGGHIGDVFEHLFSKAKISGHSFYDCRRTFLTVAENAIQDLPAIRAIMGHAGRRNDMTGRYRQWMADDRLLAVTNAVRKWLGKLPKGGAK